MKKKTLLALPFEYRSLFTCGSQLYHLVLHWYGSCVCRCAGVSLWFNRRYWSVEPTQPVKTQNFHFDLRQPTNWIRFDTRIKCCEWSCSLLNWSSLWVEWQYREQPEEAKNNEKYSELPPAVWRTKSLWFACIWKFKNRELPRPTTTCYPVLLKPNTNMINDDRTQIRNSDRIKW